MTKQGVDKKTKEIVSSLKSADEKIVLRAIKTSKVHGNPVIFEALLELLLKTSNDKIRLEILQFLNDLKSTDAIPTLIDAINDEKYLEYRAHLIGVFWNSPLNPNEHISLFVKTAIEGSFMEALECSTVIDNIEPPFPEEEVNESVLLLKDYFAADPQDEKTDLIKDILVVIQQMTQSSQTI